MGIIPLVEGIIMSSIKDLEEEIAKTSDPIVKKQIQDLIDKRKKESQDKEDELEKKVEDFFAPGVIIFIIFFIIMIILIIVKEIFL